MALARAGPVLRLWSSRARRVGRELALGISFIQKDFGAVVADKRILKAA
jgi:hypothetical protein